MSKNPLLYNTHKRNRRCSHPHSSSLLFSSALSTPLFITTFFLIPPFLCIGTSFWLTDRISSVSKQIEKFFTEVVIFCFPIGKETPKFGSHKANSKRSKGTFYQAAKLSIKNVDCLAKVPHASLPWLEGEVKHLSDKTPSLSSMTTLWNESFTLRDVFGCPLCAVLLCVFYTHKMVNIVLRKNLLSYFKTYTEYYINANLYFIQQFLIIYTLQ